jgi:hypothetical protein
MKEKMTLQEHIELATEFISMLKKVEVFLKKLNRRPISAKAKKAAWRLCPFTFSSAWDNLRRALHFEYLEVATDKDLKKLGDIYFPEL